MDAQDVTQGLLRWIHVAAGIAFVAAPVALLTVRRHVHEPVLAAEMGS